MVERYVSAAGPVSLADDIARLSADADQGVLLVLTLYTPEEESCLHVFDAPSLAMVEHATRQAGVVFDRVAAVVNITGAGARGDV